MKKCFAAVLMVVLLASCAGVRVKRTYVATGATRPKAIYIRPFDVSYTRFAGRHGYEFADHPTFMPGPGTREIRRSLAPVEFAYILREQLAKLAPTMVIGHDEVPETGWLVEGDFELVHAGEELIRKLAPHTPFGRSKVVLHVKITDLETKRSVAPIDPKEIVAADGGVRVVKTTSGHVAYEFDLAGGSGLTGPAGSVYAPGLGYATPFDFRNAAERILIALTPDPHRYGYRSSTVIR
jgi:hypothetical protein